MFCFSKNGDIIEKYNVIFNEEEIKKLKKEIINNCSTIEHVEFTSDYGPVFSNTEYIRNFERTETGKHKEYDVEIRDIYHYTYDELKPPHLVSLMDHLVDGSVSILDDIINYDTSNKLKIDEQIENLKKELIDLISNEKLGYAKEKAEEKLEKLIYLKKLNENVEPIAPYHQRLLDLIQFELVDAITIEEVTRVSEFLQVNLLKKYNFVDVHSEENYKKIVKKID